MSYTHQTTAGQSGGRVQMRLKNRDGYYTYAVHTYGNAAFEENYGTIITKSVYDWIRKCQSYYNS